MPWWKGFLNRGGAEGGRRWWCAAFFYLTKCIYRSIVQNKTLSPGSLAFNQHPIPVFALKEWPWQWVLELVVSSSNLNDNIHNSAWCACSARLQQPAGNSENGLGNVAPEKWQRTGCFINSNTAASWIRMAALESQFAARDRKFESWRVPNS